MDYSDFYKKFKSPSKGFGTIPWWIWNGRLEYSEIERQLCLMKEKDIDGFMIWIRFGAEIEYLSTEYFQRVQYCVSRCAEMGMEVWFFDDFAWPSGHAHNSVQKADPDFRQRVLSCFSYELDDNCTLKLDLRPPDESGKPPSTETDYIWVGNFGRNENKCIGNEPKSELFFDDRKVERVIAVKIEGGHPVADTAYCICEHCRNGRLIWSKPSGVWRVLVLLSRDFRQNIDMLNPEAVKCFIENTHEKYKHWVGKYFGTTIKGFFADEPRAIRFGLDKPQFGEPTIPFTRRFFDRLMDGGIKNIDAVMVSVFGNASDENTYNRILFWKKIAAWYRESFFYQLASWAQRHDLEYMADCFSEDAMNLVAYMDYFNTTSPLQRPGLDCLGLPVPNDIKIYKGPKFASSVAHANNRQRCMAEGPGLLGYECDLEQLKRCTDWLYAFGVNQIVPNAFMYTISHENLYEPPSYFYQWTLWNYYQDFDSYVKRLGNILTQGRHCAPVAVLYPTSSLLGNYDPLVPSGVYGGAHLEVFTKGTNEIQYIQQINDAVVKILLTKSLDFDFIDEEMIAAYDEDGSGLNFNNRDFKILIIPAATVLTKDSWESIKKISKIVPVIFIGSLPVKYADIKNKPDGIKEEISEIFRINPDEILNISNDKNACELVMSHVDGWNFIKAASQIDSSILAEILVDRIDSLITRDILVENGEDAIISHHRRFGQYDILFLVNQSDEQQPANVIFSKRGALYRWDPADGSQETLNSEAQDNGIRYRHNFQPYESLLLILDTQAKNNKSIILCSGETSNEFFFPDRWQFEIVQKNWLPLNKMRIDSSWKTRAAWKADMTYSVETEFYAREIPQDMQLILDYIQPYWRLKRLHLTLNGKPLKVQRDLKIDSEWLSACLDDCMCEGINRIKIYYEYIDYPVLGRDLQDVKTSVPVIPKIRLAGKFRLAEDNCLINALCHTLKTGSWSTQGYPYYSGTAIYKAEIEVKPELATPHTKLTFESLASVARIKLNGKYAGNVFWNPRQVNIGKYLRNGKNIFEFEVTNAQANMMYEQPCPSGILGKVKLTTP